MNPNADMRYQTADEMLEAFRQLHRRDRRVIRRKRRIVLWTAVSSILFLAGGTSTFSGLRQMERIQEATAYLFPQWNDVSGIFLRIPP